MLFELPVKVTNALVTPVCVKRILSPITPPFTRVDKFGSITGTVFTNVTAAFAGAAIIFVGIKIETVSTIDKILKRFNSFTPDQIAQGEYCKE